MMMGRPPDTNSSLTGCLGKGLAVAGITTHHGSASRQKDLTYNKFTVGWTILCKIPTFISVSVNVATMPAPTVYLLSGEFIAPAITPSTPLYHLSQSLDSLTHNTTSIKFSRLLDNNSPITPNPNPIYNLVHPFNAHHRTDIPSAFFITRASSVPSPTQGNIKFLPSSSPSPLKKRARKYLLPFHKPTFTALLNAGSTSSSSPLFPGSGCLDVDGEVGRAEGSGSTSKTGEEGLQVLFTAKASRRGRVWQWRVHGADSGKGGQVVAREEGGDGKEEREPRLTLLSADEMAQEIRDALVALWVLRLWWGVAEEKDFQAEGMG